MTFDDISSGFPEPMIALAQSIREVILAQSPDITEHFHGSAKVRMGSYYIGPNTNVVAVLGLAQDHCKLFLHHTDKIDAMGLKLEGKGSHARHVKIRSIDELKAGPYGEVLAQVTRIVAGKAA